MIARLSSLLGRARKCAADSRGVAAVEFAFIAPVALILLSVGVAAGQTLTVYHKVVLAAHTVTDLVSRTVYTQNTSVSQAELLNQSALDNDLAMSQMVLYPESATAVTVVLSELQVNATTNQGTVVWSEACNASGTGNAWTCGLSSKLAVGTIVSLNSNYGQAGASYLVYGQVYYAFQPFNGILSLPAMTLSSTEILTIRNAQQITVVWGS